MLTRLLQKRFGELPAALRERLGSASLEQLDAWLECLLGATSLDEILDCVDCE